MNLRAPSSQGASAKRSRVAQVGSDAAMTFAAEEELRLKMAALRTANEPLQSADRQKDEFLAVLSHELRNPLAPIRNSLCILDRAAPGSEQARRAQATIDRQVNHMAMPNFTMWPLVALTGYALAEDHKKATDAGFDRHLAETADLGARERVLSELPARHAA